MRVNFLRRQRDSGNRAARLLLLSIRTMSVQVLAGPLNSRGLNLLVISQNALLSFVALSALLLDFADSSRAMRDCCCCSPPWRFAVRRVLPRRLLSLFGAVRGRSTRRDLLVVLC